jgi:general secretion pathway protein L
LLSPLEELHFAAARTAGDEVGVAVVAKATLRGWLERLAAAGVRPDVLIPESLALAADAATTPVLLEDARALVRLAPWSAFACSQAELPDWLAQAQAAGALAPLAVHDVRAAASVLALPPPVASQRRHAPDALAFFAAALDGAPGKELLNLLDGEFAPRHRRARGLRSWRLAAALAAVVVVLAVAGLGADVLRLARTSARLDALAQDAVRGAFPDLDPAQFARLTPEQLMQGRLDRLRGGSESAGLLRVLGQVGPVLASTSRMQTRGLEYRNGTLELSLRVADVAALDSVRERLAIVPGVTAEVTAANPGADGVDGRIRVGGGAR